jgi:hypothetical protein
MTSSVTLRIWESIWYGRALTQPAPTEREIELPVGGTFVLNFHGDQYPCAVTQIDSAWVEIAPVGTPPALVDETGGIGPGRMASPTRLAVGQRLRLSPWALDAGAIWEITVLDILI